MGRVEDAGKCARMCTHTHTHTHTHTPTKTHITLRHTHTHTSRCIMVLAIYYITHNTLVGRRGGGE